MPHYRVVQVRRINATIVKYAESVSLSITSERRAAGWSGQRSRGKHGPYQWQQTIVVDVISEPS